MKDLEILNSLALLKSIKKEIEERDLRRKNKGTHLIHKSRPKDILSPNYTGVRLVAIFIGVINPEK